MADRPMSIAEQIASRFRNSTTWTDQHGVDLTACLAGYGSFEIKKDQDTSRFVFPDGSAIVTWACTWGIGYPAPATCCCWLADGHAPDCPER